jgi:imidazolonepropionase-like amidohydrolase
VALVVIVMAAVSLVLVIRPSQAQRPVTVIPTAGQLLLDDVTVVDPRDGGLLPGMAVQMAGGRITRVSKAGTVTADPSIQRVDGRGKFVVPGYNDMHLHVLGAADPSGELALLLADGVTGFRQMSGSEDILKERREHRLPLNRYSPALLAMPGEVLTPFNAGSPSAARAEIDRQKAEGADFIKVGLVSPDVFWAVLDEAKRVGLRALGHLQVGVDPARASREGFHSIEHLGPGDPVWIACSRQRDALFAEAAKHPAIKAPPFKIPFLETIVAWRLQTILINPAAFSKPDDIARLQSALDSYDPARCDALTAQFRSNETWNVPTLVRLRTQELPDDPAYQRSTFLKYMPQANIDRWQGVLDRFRKLPAPTLATLRAQYPRNLALTKRLSDAGVPLMAGTDGGGLAMPGMSLHEEFDELARAGISPLKILQMTTTAPATFLGRSASMGRVADGYDANLVLLDANPLDGVANLHRIAGVVRAGFYYSAADLATMRAQVAHSRGSFRAPAKP